MSAANSSLPVPVSPSSNTVESVAATCRACSSTRPIARLSPTIPCAPSPFPLLSGRPAISDSADAVARICPLHLAVAEGKQALDLHGPCFQLLYPSLGPTASSKRHRSSLKR